MILVPTSKHNIPVHPSTDGWEKQQLAVERHEFPAKTKANRKIAFVFSHSNGFHKESLHPLMRRFVAHLRSLKEYDHTDITLVAWDARTHGDSARLNEGIFEDSYRWSDNALDTLQVIEEMGLDQGYDKLIGVGHSFGASSMILLEYYFPNTFDALCVIEPVMEKIFIAGELQKMSPVLASRKRRDEWPSREECHKSLASRGFFKLLHPEVLDNYVNYGMYDTENGTIKLKCPRESEYHIFKNAKYDTNVAFRSLRLLKIPVHFVYALDSSFVSRDEAAGVINENKEMITLEFIEGTHMVPNETPDLVVPQIMKILSRLNVKSKL